MKLKACLLLLLLLAPLCAHAVLCKPLKDLKKQVFSCEQNDYFSEAAILCLEGFEGGAKKKAEAIGLTLFKSGNAQAQSIAGNSLNLEKAQALSALLLVEALARKAEVEDYGRNINFPEDFDNPLIVNHDPEKFLGDSHCYRRAATIHESVLEELEKHIAELKSLQNATAQILEAQKGASLESAGISAKSTKGKGSGEKTIPGTGPSDITGTAEEKTKREK